MATIYEWPDLLTPRSIKFNLAARSRTGGVSLSGQEQVVSSGAGIWTATYGEIPVVRTQQVKLFRAMGALLEGRVGLIRAPVYDALQAPWPIVNGQPVMGYPPIAHSDGSFFSDHSGYAQTIIAVKARAASAGDTTLTVDVERAGEIVDGNHFSINDRLYRIKFFAPGTDANSLVLQVWPPLREDVAAGSVCNFDRPVCIMRLATDNEMDLTLDYGRWDNPTVSLVEVF